MLVFAWFTFVAIVILAGFVMLAATFVHWYRQSAVGQAQQRDSKGLPSKN